MDIQDPQVSKEIMVTEVLKDHRGHLKMAFKAFLVVQAFREKKDLLAIHLRAFEASLAR